MESILIVYNGIPYPSTGENIRVFYLLKELSRYYEITLLTLKNRRGDFDLSKLKKFCDIVIAPCFVEEFLKKPKFISYFFKALYLKFERLFSPFKSKSLKNYNYQTFCLKKELKHLLNKKKFDYIQVEHSYFGHIINDIKVKVGKILDFHDVHSYMKNCFRERRLIKKYEIELIKKFDLAICCSRIDKARLKKLGYQKILIVPNGVDTKYFKMESNENPLSLVFVGSMEYHPNFEGIKYFFKRIYPLLPPHIKINIIGKYDKDKFRKERKLKNVNFYGFVKDIRPYLKNTVFICPILTGGGTRLKILTAFSAGSPVVSTSKGAEGIEYADNKNIFIANTPRLFAKKIQDIFSYNADYKKLRKNARKLVESKYNWKKIIEKYHENLKKLKNKK